MSLVEQLEAACQEELDRIANEIYSEMTGVVSRHTVTGEALSSIRLERTSETSRFVGGANDHLYYLNYGRGEVKPVRRKMLKYTDGSFHRYSRPYAGLHFIEDIANRYR